MSHPRPCQQYPGAPCRTRRIIRMHEAQDENDPRAGRAGRQMSFDGTLRELTGCGSRVWLLVSLVSTSVFSAARKRALEIIYSLGTCINYWDQSRLIPSMKSLFSTRFRWGVVGVLRRCLEITMFVAAFMFNIARIGSRNLHELVTSLVVWTSDSSIQYNFELEASAMTNGAME